MTKILIFAGTSEGRALAEHFQNSPLNFTFCVATKYGQELLPKGQNIQVISKRLTKDQMAALMKQESFACVIDATHPYAVEATANINQAAKEARIPYLRLERQPGAAEVASNHLVWVKSISQAIDYLNQHQGKALLTTGSKDLGAFIKVIDFEKRLYPRILPIAQGLEDAIALGYPAAHMLAMQGPFSADLNAALLKEVGASYLITKESGLAGGFEAKLEGAKIAGVTVIIIQRPKNYSGLSQPEIIKWLESRYLNR